MNYRNFLIMLLSLVALSSCDKDETLAPGAKGFQFQYFISSYIYPKSISVSDKMEVYFNSDSEINIENSPERFKELAKHHNEDGKKEITYWRPPVGRMPYGISKIQVFSTDKKGEKIDISDKTQVSVHYFKQFILSDYKEGYAVWTKLVSELTKDDLKWLSNPLEIQPMGQYGKCSVTITLEDGTKLSSE